jgi:MFS family permease
MVGTLPAFGNYALGFVARPLGGLVFGHYGDKIGRKTMLYLGVHDRACFDHRRFALYATETRQEIGEN